MCVLEWQLCLFCHPSFVELEKFTWSLFISEPLWDNQALQSKVVLKFLSWFLKVWTTRLRSITWSVDRFFVKNIVIDYPHSIYMFMRRCFKYDYLKRPNGLYYHDTEKLISLDDDLNLWLCHPYHRNISFYTNANLLQITCWSESHNLVKLLKDYLKTAQICLRLKTVEICFRCCYIFFFHQKFFICRVFQVFLA